jgi:hypothetical protein
LPDKLSWQMDYLRVNTSYDGVFNAYSINSSGRWKVIKEHIKNLTLRDCLLNTVSIGSSSNLLFRSNVFSTAGLWDETLKRQQDKELLIRILVNHQIGYDQKVALKVSGHNDPHPLKSIPGHEVYYDKAKDYLVHLDANSQRKFHSFHYRRLCMYYLMLGDYKKAFTLYQQALEHQKLHLRKDTKNLVYLTKSIFSNKGNTVN